MEKSTLIKLRQRESTDVAQNGAYNVSLKESVTLEEGDVVKLHTAILDTSTESFVTLEDDIEIDVDVANYVRNYKTNNPIAQHFQVAINDSQPDLNMYMPCFENTLSGNEYKLESCILFSRRPGKTEPITIRFHYNDPVTGERVNDSQFVPSFEGIKHATKGYTVELNRLIRGTTVVMDTTNTEFETHHIKDFTGSNEFVISSSPIPNPGGTEVHNTLFTRNLKFTISAGRYYPSEIATILNDNFSKLDSIGTIGYDVALNKYPVESPFMNTLHQINYLVTDASKLNKSINYNPTIPVETEDPTNLCEYDTSALTSATDPLIGANEVSINYDDNLKKLNFDALHFPFYVGATAPDGGGQPGIVYPGLPTDTPPVYLQPNSGANAAIPHEPQVNYGGCFFTRMEPIDFWTEQLGFVDMIVSPELSNDLLTGRTNSSAVALPDIYPIKVFLTPGKNIVTSFSGLDNIVPKNDQAYIPSLGSVSQALTTPIISQREFDTPHNDEGYYLIEVGMNIPQKMIGGSIRENTTSNKVQAIMGKYFTAGNFLQSQGQGVLVYEHEGDPVLLSDLAVTIRNPDMSLPNENDLGDKNSIFLEVVKTIPSPEQTTEN